MQLTNTWRQRLHTAGRGSAKLLITVLVASAAINGLNIAWHWIFPTDPPAIAATARTVNNQTALVESYAIDCVTVLLTASSSRAAEVARCFPDSSTTMALPPTPSLIVTAQAATSTLEGQSALNMTTYGVVVAVTQQAYNNAPPTRAYYQLPVSVYGGSAPRAMGMPARRDPPPTGVDPKLDYPITITDDAVATMLSGFVRCYLTSTTGLDRFTTVDSGLGPLSAYATATVSAIRAQNTAAANPTDGTEQKVLVSVTARAADYSTVPLQYPLTLRASGGAWSVARIDPMPVIDTESPPQPARNR